MEVNVVRSSRLKMFSQLALATVLSIIISPTLSSDLPQNTAVNLSKHPILIIISYDGFRYDYLDKANTPNLDRIRRSGVSAPHMDNQFLTYTFPNHHSIATGLYIESHGIIANSLYDPLYGKVLSGYNNEPGFWNYSQEILPVYTVNELAGDGRVSGVMMWTGSGEPWGKNDTHATHTVLYNDSIPYEDRVDTVMSWITDPEKPANLVFLYFEEPDSTGHDKGPEGPEIIHAIERMDNVTGYILTQLEQLGISDKVNLIFLSDHGMEEIKPQQRVEYKQIVDPAKYNNYGGTPVMQILPKNLSETKEIYNAFQAEAELNGHFVALLRDELNVTKPHWHYSNNRRIMPILLVVEPGYAFNESWNDDSTPTGAHGFDNTHSNMWPYFMARGPLFKSGGAMVETFSNIDLYPLVCLIMGMEKFAGPHNGSLARTLPLLKTLDLGLDGNSRGVSPPGGHWLSKSGPIIGLIVGVLFLSIVVGFLVFKHRQSRSETMELNWNG